MNQTLPCLCPLTLTSLKMEEWWNNKSLIQWFNIKYKQTFFSLLVLYVKPSNKSCGEFKSEFLLKTNFKSNFILILKISSIPQGGLICTPPPPPLEILVHSFINKIKITCHQYQYPVFVFPRCDVGCIGTSPAPPTETAAITLTCSLTSFAFGVTLDSWCS